MVIEYQIKRIDLVKSFFYNIFHSQRTQIIVFGSTALVFIYILFLRFRNKGYLSLLDFALALAFALMFCLGIPATSYITAKTQKRVLTITPEGIETKIGSQSGKIAWKAVDTIVATNKHIFIIGKNANNFTIPSRAFASDALRNKFIDLASQFHDMAKLSS